MGSFYLVSSGNPTNSADINQYASALDATTGAQVALLSTNASTAPLLASLSGAPSTDQTVVQAQVAADAFARVAFYIRHTDGYGGIAAGAGVGAATAHLYAQAGGWQMDEGLAINGGLSVLGTSSLAGITARGVVATSLQSSGGLTVAGATVLDNGAMTSDGGGNLTLAGVSVTAPPTLRAGHQEPGYCGLGLYTNASGVGVAHYVNFKTVLQNTPSSITFAIINNINATSLGAFQLSTVGFEMHWLSTAAGSTLLGASYTTVGNCLLAVDTQARTFDHHCDECHTLRRGLLLDDAALAARVRPGTYHLRRNHLRRDVVDHHSHAVALTYTCPNCGALESFDTRMTAADEADATPQGTGEYATTRGAQAVMIRQLLRLLSLPIAD